MDIDNERIENNPKRRESRKTLAIPHNIGERLADINRGQGLNTSRTLRFKRPENPATKWLNDINTTENPYSLELMASHSIEKGPRNPQRHKSGMDMPTVKNFKVLNIKNINSNSKSFQVQASQSKKSSSPRNSCTPAAVGKGGTLGFERDNPGAISSGSLKFNETMGKDSSSQFYMSSKKLSSNMKSSNLASSAGHSKSEVKRRKKRKSKHKKKKKIARLRDSIKIDFYIILPDDPWKLRWDYLMIALLLYMATVVPYRIAFYDEDSLGWIITDSIVDCFFGLDIIFNFFYAFFNFYEDLIVDRKKIAKRYLSTWFVIDLIAIIPLNLVLQTQRDYSSMARLARLPRLYRLVKMLKLVRMMRIVRERNMFLKHLNDVLKISASLERLIFFAFVFILICHINACLWYLLARIDGIHPDSWVVRYGHQDSSNYELYVAGFYWTITTVTTVGFGDICALTPMERWYAMAVMVVGVICYSFAVGSLSSILSSLDSREATLKEKLDILNSIKSDFKVPMELYMRLRKALKYDHTKNLMDRFQFLKELPGNLQLELSYLMHHDIIKDFPFFRNKSKQLIAKIGPMLRPMKIFKDDIVFREGDPVDEIFFLYKGTVAMILPEYDDAAFVEIVEGYHFGELEYIKGCEDDAATKRLFTIKAKTDCEMLCLSQKNMFAILADNEELSELFETGESRLIRTLKQKEKMTKILEEDAESAINPRVSIATFGLFTRNKEEHMQALFSNMEEIAEKEGDEDEEDSSERSKKSSFDSSEFESSNFSEESKKSKHSDNNSSGDSDELEDPDPGKAYKIESKTNSLIKEEKVKDSFGKIFKNAPIRDSGGSGSVDVEPTSAPAPRKISWKRRLTQNFGALADIHSLNRRPLTPLPVTPPPLLEEPSANSQLLTQIPDMISNFQSSILAQISTLKQQMDRKEENSSHNIIQSGKLEQIKEENNVRAFKRSSTKDILGLARKSAEILDPYYDIIEEKEDDDEAKSNRQLVKKENELIIDEFT